MDGLKFVNHSLQKENISLDKCIYFGGISRLWSQFKLLIVCWVYQVC